MNLGAYPFDPKTPVGRVRLLVGDTDPVPEGEPESSAAGTYLWYSDAEIESLIEMFGGNFARTAAHVTRSVGRDEAMMLKKWSSADLTVDGPALARTMFAAAAEMDKLADSIDEGLNAEHSFALVPTGGYSAVALETHGFTFTPEDLQNLRATWFTAV